MYFIRVNGDTAHNNPAKPDCFVPNEPPQYPAKYFNYLYHCLNGNFIRIGWPDIGDLHTKNKQSSLAKCYDWQRLKPYIKNYLDGFFNIPIGSTVLMPDKKNPGDLYIGTTTSHYYFYHNVPIDPYDCAHRIDVEWDVDKKGEHIIYQASDLGISIYGGMWRWAFFKLKDPELIQKIRNVRP